MKEVIVGVVISLIAMTTGWTASTIVKLNERVSVLEVKKADVHSLNEISEQLVRQTVLLKAVSSQQDEIQKIQKEIREDMYRYGR